MDRKRCRRVLVFGVLLAASLALPSAGPARGGGLSAAPPGTRAMWMWSDPDPAAAGDVIAWSSVRGVSEIFVNVQADVATNGTLPGLKELKRQADTAGIRLSALGGAPGWATSHSTPLAWQRAVVKTGLFGGLHVDAEPYLLPEWSSNQNATAKSYLTMLDLMRTASPLPIEVDVPFWYGQYTVGGKNLATEVLQRVTAVSVMSYRNTGTGPNSMFEVSRDWLVRGGAKGKRVRLGAETGPVDDCAYCSFVSDGATVLGTELAKVDAATRITNAYAGIAIHHYDAWRKLPA